MSRYILNFMDDRIVITESGNIISDTKVMLRHWLYSYIIQVIIEKAESQSEKKRLQNNLEEYCFAIFNANSEEDICIPTPLNGTVDVIKETLCENGSNNPVNSKDMLISNSELRSAIDAVYGDYCQDIIRLQDKSELTIHVSNNLGVIFKEKCKEELKIFGQVTEDSPMSIKAISVQVYYGDMKILEANKSTSADIICGEETSDGICLSVVYEGSKRLIDKKKLCFPFWYENDVIHLELAEENSQLLLFGTHQNSGIRSKLLI